MCNTKTVVTLNSSATNVILEKMRVIFFAALCALVIFGSPRAHASGFRGARHFYHGKVLTVIVPYGAAGGYEYWVATLRPFLEKTLGVSQINIINQTGGGGIVGADAIYRARPNGLTIGEVNGTGAVFAQIAAKPGVSFDIRKFAWIGSPDTETIVGVTDSASPIQMFGDLLKARLRKHKIVGLSAGVGDIFYVATALPLSAFHIPFKMLVAYQGSSAVKGGLLRGDGDLAAAGFSAFRSLIQSGKIRPLYIASTKASPLLPGVPTILQLAVHYNLPKSKIRALRIFSDTVGLGKDFAAPPGVAPDRLAFLRWAFRKATTNRKFIEAAQKSGRVPGYAGPNHIDGVINRAIMHKNVMINYLR